MPERRPQSRHDGSQPRSPGLERPANDLPGGALRLGPGSRVSPSGRFTRQSLRNLPGALLPRLRRSLGSPLAGQLLRRSLRPIRQRLGWLWGQDGSPGHRARGLAAGVFTGCLPFFGLQIVLGVALAAALRGNRLLAAAGTWISNPLTTLPMCWLNYQVGALMLGPGPAWPGMNELNPERLGDLGWAFSSRLLLGSVVIGAAAALLAGVACWRWLQGRQITDTGRRP